ncbi:MAG: queuosine precursor transporter [Flavobacteriaceae bacterium]
MVNKNLLLFLIIIHVFITTLSNALVAIPLNIYDFKITWGALIFPFVVVITDLTVRLVGERIAQKAIFFSYPLAIISSILVVFFEGNLLSVALRIGIASATAYVLGMTIDVYAFQAIREKYSSWWIAPSLSTVISNVIDSYVFFFAAFYNSENIYMSKNWIEIATTQTIIKIIIGLIFFLPAYGILLNFLLKYIKKKDNLIN